MSKILFSKTEHFCFVLATEVPRSTEKYGEIQRSKKKSEKHEKLRRSMVKYKEV
jgi:hypothetical protein